VCVWGWGGWGGGVMGGHFRRACEGFNMFFIYLDSISVSTTDQEKLVSALYQLCAVRSMTL